MFILVITVDEVTFIDSDYFNCQSILGIIFNPCHFYFMLFIYFLLLALNLYICLGFHDTSVMLFLFYCCYTIFFVSLYISFTIDKLKLIPYLKLFVTQL